MWGDTQTKPRTRSTPDQLAHTGTRTTDNGAMHGPHHEELGLCLICWRETSWNGSVNFCYAKTFRLKSVLTSRGEPQHFIKIKLPCGLGQLHPVLVMPFNANIAWQVLLRQIKWHPQDLLTSQGPHLQTASSWQWDFSLRNGGQTPTRRPEHPWKSSMQLFLWNPGTVLFMAAVPNRRSHPPFLKATNALEMIRLIICQLSDW